MMSGNDVSGRAGCGAVSDSIRSVGCTCVLSGGFRRGFYHIQLPLMFVQFFLGYWLK